MPFHAFLVQGTQPELCGPISERIQIQPLKTKATMIRLNAFRAGYKGNGKLFRLKAEDIGGLIAQACAALDCPNGRTIFNSEGAEVDDVDLLDDKEKIYLSSGESFSEPTRSASGNFVWYRFRRNEPYEYFETSDDLTMSAFRSHLAAKYSVPRDSISLSVEKAGNVFEKSSDVDVIEARQSFAVELLDGPQQTQAQLPVPEIAQPPPDSPFTSSISTPETSSRASSLPGTPAPVASNLPTVASSVRGTDNLPQLPSPVEVYEADTEPPTVSFVPPSAMSSTAFSQRGDDMDSVSDTASTVDVEWGSIRQLRVTELLARTELVREELAKLENERQLEELLDSSDETLLTIALGILRDHFAAQYFHSFLRRIVCEENLLFYNSVCQYESRPELSTALEIFHTFIDNAAQLQVNLPYAIVHELERALEGYLVDKKPSRKKLTVLDKQKLTKATASRLSLPDSPGWNEGLTRSSDDILLDPELFSDAKGTVVRLMATDCLPRFLSAIEYKNMLKNMDRRISKATRRIPPLFLAAQRGQGSAVEAALDGGALVELRNELGDTPMHLAACHGRLKVMQILLDRGATVNPVNDVGDTPLAMAAAGGAVRACKFLLAHGAAVGAVNRSGDSALHQAARANSLPAAKVLIEAGADVDLKNGEGKTALHVSGEKVGAYVRALLFKPLLGDYRKALGPAGGDDLISWTPQWSVGVETCDVEHQQLFEYLNLLWKMVSEDGSRRSPSHGLSLLPVLSALVDYTSVHFENEEQMMKNSSMPIALISKHEKEHRKFKKKVAGFVRQFRSGDANLDKKLLHFLRDWLMNHIAKSDMEYAQYVEKS